MATLATFRTNISAILGLDNSTSGDQTQIDAYVNEGVLEVLKATKCYIVSADVSLGAGVGDYTLDTDVLEMRDIYTTSGGSTYILERRTPYEILDLRRASSASPTRYYALQGQNLLMLHPDPADADTLTMYYVPMPTALSSSAHTPSNASYGGIPEENHNVIELYALWRLADMDDDASSGQGDRYRAYYEKALMEMRRHLNKRGGPRLARARVNPRRSSGVPPIPSTSPAYYP